MLLILFAAVFAVRDPIEELYQRAGESVREPARRRLVLAECNVQTEAECTNDACVWYDNKCMTKWGEHKCSASSGFSYTCLAGGKYLQQTNWKADSNGEYDCKATPSMRVNLYHGKCTDIFGAAFGNGKFICAKDGSIYVDSCAAGEQPTDVWGLMSSVEEPFDSSCTANDGDYSKFSCDSDKRLVMTMFEDDSTCTDFEMKMVYTKTCKNYAIQTGDNGETTVFPISVACDDSSMLMTLCADDAELITDTNNDFLAMDYIDVKVETGCDCDPDEGCTKYQCTADSMVLKAYSDTTCQTETKSATMPLNIMKKQSFPPAGFDDDGTFEFVFQSECKNNIYTMKVGSVFSAEDKYVSPSEITQEGNTMKVGDKTVTAKRNGDIAPKVKHSDDPSYAKSKSGNNGNSSAELMVLFGFLASIFAL